MSSRLHKSIPFYMQISRILRQEILSGVHRADHAFPSELDLAERFEVCKDVVRQSLRLLAGEGLLRRIRGQGTFLGEAVKDTGSSQVFLTSFQGAEASGALAQALQPGVDAHGMALSVCRVPLEDLEAEATALRDIASRHPRAILASPALDGDRDNRNIYNQLLANGMPLILIDRHVPAVMADAVYFDYEGSMHAATQALLASGCQRPAVVMAGLHYRVGQARLEGAKRAFKEHGIEWSNNSVLALDNELASDPVALRRALRNAAPETGIGGKAEPDGLIVSSAWLAWLVFQILRKEGRAASLRSIAAIADRPAGDADFNALLGARYRLFDELGAVAAEVLTQRLSGDAAPGVPIVRPVPCRALTGAEAQARFYVRTESL